ncbi:MULTISPECIES: hypothetical protein [Clostridium]|uniref:Phage protein n=1 Tax=Clostridium carnis TaxID=1530 RepID=A0ABY6SRG6_9CLOT|nr:hypothetical protein [Clostridium carnis]CAI3542927.1 Phage protein [Clostridium neonatale]CAI3561030.1 Phage protein [Clostridium neonatale]CAI3562384.1 Phage protein [Clostridium neonatale]CAI3583320.1 Phage protein [Clostridium neonatale]CAI3623064.1 Phage protein [Clostridium neonatale]
MNPQEIMDEIKKAKNELSKLNDNLKSFGIQKEKAEQIYRIELSKKLLKLRLDKTPSSIIQDVAKGDAYISKLRLERGLAENNYTVCQEALRIKRIELEMLRSLLTWQRVELGNS